MANFVTVAALESTSVAVKNRPAGVSIPEHVLGHIRREIAKVTPDKPDLIVLTEACDRPNDMSTTEVLDYYMNERGDSIIKGLGEIAKENNCYIAFGTWYLGEDGYGRNGCAMVDRQGKLMGYYTKNHLTPYEYDWYNLVPGEEETIFDCDFGPVGALTCFDMNFYEIREKYKKRHPKIVVFDSHYNGGLVRNFFAIDCQCFLVSCSPFPSDITSPMGTVVQTATGYYKTAVARINLDYAICHLDFNRPRFQAAKEKYGPDFKITEPGGLGFVMISYEGTDKTIEDIMKEFEIETYDEYLARSRQMAKEALEKIKNK